MTFVRSRWGGCSLFLLVAMVLSTGCGTMFNKKEKDLYLYDGATINGNSRMVTVNQKESYRVEYADGRESCELEPEVSTAYFILDLFATAFVGIIVDAVTGDWKVIDAGECDGVFDEQQQF